MKNVIIFFTRLYVALCRPRFLALLLVSSCLVNAQTFLDLGHLTHFENSRGIAISDDGQSIVGDAFTSGFNESQAFRWSRDQGMVPLFDSSPSSVGDVLSGDGKSGAGRVILSGVEHTWLWRQDGNILDIGDLPGDGYSANATGISADGSKIAGTSWSSRGNEAFLWTEATGMLGLGFLPGTFFNPESVGYNISRDGSVVIGDSRSAATTSGYGSFRWTSATGMVALDAPGDRGTTVFSVSDDGNTLVGQSDLGAVRWTPDHGFATLPLPGLFGAGAVANAVDVSGNGALIIGWAYDQNHYDGVFWLGTSQSWTLDGLIRDYGFDLDGWSELTPESISQDGRYLTGGGIRNGVEDAFLLDFGPGGFIPPSAVPEPASFAKFGVIGIMTLMFSRAGGCSKMVRVLMSAAHATRSFRRRIPKRFGDRRRNVTTSDVLAYEYLNGERSQNESARPRSQHVIWPQLRALASRLPHLRPVGSALYYRVKPLISLSLLVGCG